MTAQTKTQSTTKTASPSPTTTKKVKETVTIREAVKIALISQLHCRTLARKGIIAGKKDETGKWQLERQSVVEYAKKRQEAYELRIQRIRNGENVQNIRPTTATCRRMRKAVENDTQLSEEHKKAFNSAIDRYEAEWNRKYDERKAKK